MIHLTLGLPPPGLRRNHGKTRFTAGLRTAYSDLVYQSLIQQGALSQNRLSGALHATVGWYQTGPGDTDNCLSGCKPVFDILGCAPRIAAPKMIYCGLYEDDGQITRICVERFQVKTKSEERIELTITEVP